MSERLKEIDEEMMKLQNGKDDYLRTARGEILGGTDLAETYREERERYLAAHREDMKRLARERDEIIASLPKDPNAVTISNAGGIESQEKVGGLG